MCESLSPGEEWEVLFLMQVSDSYLVVMVSNIWDVPKLRNNYISAYNSSGINWSWCGKKQSEVFQYAYFESTLPLSKIPRPEIKMCVHNILTLKVWWSNWTIEMIGHSIILEHKEKNLRSPVILTNISETSSILLSDISCNCFPCVKEISPAVTDTQTDEQAFICFLCHDKNVLPFCIRCRHCSSGDKIAFHN